MAVNFGNLKVPESDVTPIRRGIHIVCANPSLACSMKYLKYMIGLNYAATGDVSRQDITITAWNDMDSNVAQYLYGLAFNICNTCQKSALAAMQQKNK